MSDPLKYFKTELKKMSDPKVLALMGLFLALGILFTRILKPLDLPYLRISFGFLATALCSMLLGPFLGGINAALADIAGFFLFPSAGAIFFPGLTVSALLTGVIFGIFLYKKPITIMRVSLAVLIITIFIDMLLNTTWLSILLGRAWMVLFPMRALKSVIWLPVQVFFIYYIWKYISKNVTFARSL